jgi:hypothetical protein
MATPVRPRIWPETCGGALFAYARSVTAGDVVGATAARWFAPDTSTPTLPNSPWIRPQSGFATAIWVTSVRMVASVLGRPTRIRAERRVHRRRSHSRCHRTTVSGWTSTSAARQCRPVWANAIQNRRSRLRSCGRQPVRFKALSCWRSASCQVLEDQFVMSAAGQHQRADEYKDHLEHASILSLLQGAKQSITRPVLIVANDTVHRDEICRSYSDADNALRLASGDWRGLSAERLRGVSWNLHYRRGKTPLTALVLRPGADRPRKILGMS